MDLLDAFCADLTFGVVFVLGWEDFGKGTVDLVFWGKHLVLWFNDLTIISIFLAKPADSEALLPRRRCQIFGSSSRNLRLSFCQSVQSYRRGANFDVDERRIWCWEKHVFDQDSCLAILIDFSEVLWHKWLESLQSLLLNTVCLWIRILIKYCLVVANLCLATLLRQLTFVVEFNGSRMTSDLDLLLWFLLSL